MKNVKHNGQLLIAITCVQISTLSFSQQEKDVFSFGRDTIPKVYKKASEDGNRIESLCNGVEKGLPADAFIHLGANNNQLTFHAEEIQNILMVNSYGYRRNISENTCLYDCKDPTYVINEQIKAREEVNKKIKPIRPFTVTNDPTVLAQRPHGPHLFLPNKGPRIVLKMAMISRSYEGDSADGDISWSIFQKGNIYDPHAIVALAEKDVKKEFLGLIKANGKEYEKTLDVTKVTQKTFDTFYNPKTLWFKNKKGRNATLLSVFKQAKDKVLQNYNSYKGNLSIGIVPVYLNDKWGTLHGFGGRFECETLVSNLVGPQLMYYEAPGLPIANWDLSRLKDDENVLFYLDAGDGSGSKRDDIMAIFRVSKANLMSGKAIVYQHLNTVKGTDLVVALGYEG